MEYVKRIGTCCICFILILGFVMVLMTIGSYGVKRIGYENHLTKWFIQNVELDLNWIDELSGNERKYDFDKNLLEKYIDVCEGITGTIENFCTTSFPENKNISNVINLYKINVLQNKLIMSVGGKTKVEVVKEAVEETKQFEIYLKEKNIELVYVQLPSYRRINVASGNSKKEVEELELYDLFAETMEKTDINFINICDRMDLIRNFKLDSSNHWYPVDALTATKVIAEFLNSRLDYDIDSELFNKAEYYNILRNSELQERIQEKHGYSYELLVPTNDMHYRLNYCEEEIYKGNFTQTQLRPQQMWNVDGPYHEMWRISNGVFVDIINESIQSNQKKILILGDSFSWPITAYISQGVGEVAAMHPAYFYGSIKKYIQEFNPDLVMIIYYEGQVGSGGNGPFKCFQ